MEYVLEVFEIYHILVLLIGLVLGIIVGALPGLTPTMGVALVIPFTFTMGPTDGLILLGGIFCGSIYGGAIPAILFNVPGAPASVATTFDGYPMARQGKTTKALELATISSAIGGLFGMILLLWFAPIFTKFSLQFGPAETFWIAIFGITIIASLAEGSIAKNLIGGAVGILLSFIGISSFTGISRFTFGIDSFVGGLHIVAVLIGLFAFPQALHLIENFNKTNKRKSSISTNHKSSIRSSFVDVLKRPKAVSLGSVIGAIVGIIPGAGGNVASIMAYNEVKRFSKDKKTFGKGNKNGVIAAESANNALVGGSLIPLLTLGIPGSPTAAIFLGGLLIHGIWPGQNLFVDNAPVAYTFLYSMVIAQFLILIIGLACIRYVTRLSEIPSHYMVPIILSFSIIGAYATQNNIFDVYTMVFIGIAMFFLQKCNFSAAPIALGFILGTIAEIGLLQGRVIGAASGSTIMYFFTGTWNIILIMLIVLTLTASLVQMYKKNGFKKSYKPIKKIKISTAACTWLLFLVVSVYSFVFMQQTLDLEQRLFPQITMILLILLFLFELIKSLTCTIEKQHPNKKINYKMYGLISIISIVSLLTNLIGFYMQALLLMLIIPFYMYNINKKILKKRTICLVASLFTIALFIVFSWFMKVPIPAFFM